MASKHYDDQLRKALDEVLLTGSVAIRWDQLYLWTDAQRITKKTWRRIDEFWTEIIPENVGDSLPLTVIQMQHIVVLRRPLFGQEVEQNLADLVA